MERNCIFDGVETFLPFAALKFLKYTFEIEVEITFTVPR